MHSNNRLKNQTTDSHLNVSLLLWDWLGLKVWVYGSRLEAGQECLEGVHREVLLHDVLLPVGADHDLGLVLAQRRQAELLGLL